MLFLRYVLIKVGCVPKPWAVDRNGNAIPSCRLASSYFSNDFLWSTLFVCVPRRHLFPLVVLCVDLYGQRKKKETLP